MQVIITWATVRHGIRIKSAKQCSIKREGIRDSEISKKISDAKEKKAVAQISLSGQVLQIWPSVSSISREYGISTSSISKCCKGILQSSGGFVWKYAESVDATEINLLSDDRREELIAKGKLVGNAKQKKTVMQFNLEGDLVRVWSSLTEAAKENGMSIAAICRCCKGEVKTSGGYIWKYDEGVN